MIKINIGEQVKFKCVPVTERFYSEDSSYGVFIFHTKDDIPKYDDVPENTFDSELYAKNTKNVLWIKQKCVHKNRENTEA